MTVKGEEPYFSRTVPENIPDNWTLVPLSVICSFENGTNLPSDERKKGSIPVYGSNGIIDHHTEAITQAPVVIIGRKGSAGAVNYSRQEAFVVDTAYYIDGRSSKHNIRWMYYALKSLRLEEQSEDSAVPGMNRRLIGSHKIPLPSKDDQDNIADFLNHRTARIDALIAKQKRLLDLLDERRKTVITRAVIAGLDSTVAMKNTEIDWLREIPEHWGVAKLRWITTKIGSGVTPTGGSEAYVEDGIIFLRSQNVHFGCLQFDDVVYIDDETNAEMAATQVESGDVLLNITGASIGRCSCVPQEFPPANINQHVCIIRPRFDRLNPAFLNYAVSSHNVQYQIFSDQEGASREAVTFTQIGNFLFPLPPLSEQKQIATNIGRKVEQINTLTDKVTKSIELLSEKRQALITAAVTGQIDITKKQYETQDHPI